MASESYSSSHFKGTPVAELAGDKLTEFEQYIKTGVQSLTLAHLDKSLAYIKGSGMAESGGHFLNNITIATNIDNVSNFGGIDYTPAESAAQRDICPCCKLPSKRGNVDVGCSRCASHTESCVTNYTGASKHYTKKGHSVNTQQAPNKVNVGMDKVLTQAERRAIQDTTEMNYASELKSIEKAKLAAGVNTELPGRARSSYKSCSWIIRTQMIKLTRNTICHCCKLPANHDHKLLSQHNFSCLRCVGHPEACVSNYTILTRVYLNRLHDL